MSTPRSSHASQHGISPFTEGISGGAGDGLIAQDQQSLRQKGEVPLIALAKWIYKVSPIVKTKTGILYSSARRRLSSVGRGVAAGTSIFWRYTKPGTRILYSSGRKGLSLIGKNLLIGLSNAGKGVKALSIFISKSSSSIYKKIRRSLRRIDAIRKTLVFVSKIIPRSLRSASPIATTLDSVNREGGASTSQSIAPAAGRNWVDYVTCRSRSGQVRGNTQRL